MPIELTSFLKKLARFLPAPDQEPCHDEFIFNDPGDGNPHFGKNWLAPQEKFMFLFRELEDSSIARVQFLNTFLSSRAVNQVYLERLFQRKSWGATIYFRHDDNLIKWLSDLLSNPDATPELATEILNLLIAHSDRLAKAMDVRLNYGPRPAISYLLDLITKLTQQIPIPPEVLAKIYKSCLKSRDEIVTYEILRNFNEKIFNTATVYELLAHPDHKARLTDASIFYFWEFIETTTISGELRSNEFRSLFRIFTSCGSISSSTSVNRLNHLILNLFQKKPELVQELSSPYFPHLREYYGDAHFHNELFNFVKEHVTEEPQDHINQTQVFNMGMSTSLITLQPDIVTKYLQLAKQTVCVQKWPDAEKNIVENILRLFTDIPIRDGGNNFYKSANNLVSIVFILIQQFKLSQENISFLKKHSAYLIRRILSADCLVRPALVLEALLPNTVLHACLDNDALEPLYELIVTPQYSLELLSLVRCTPLNKELYKRIKAGIPHMMTSLIHTQKLRYIRDALNPRCYLYQFLGAKFSGLFSTGDLVIDHNAEYLQTLRVAHFQTLLNMIQQREFSLDELTSLLNSLKEARVALVEKINTLEKDHEKRDCIYQILQIEKYPLYQLMWGDSNTPAIDNLVRNNATTIIDLILKNSLSGPKVLNKIVCLKLQLVEHISKIEDLEEKEGLILRALQDNSSTLYQVLRFDNKTNAIGKLIEDNPAVALKLISTRQLTDETQTEIKEFIPLLVSAIRSQNEIKAEYLIQAITEGTALNQFMAMGGTQKKPSAALRDLKAFNEKLFSGASSSNSAPPLSAVTMIAQPIKDRLEADANKLFEL